MTSAAAGKELYEHLEVIFAHVEDTTIEASLDAVLNELVQASAIAAQHDHLGRAMAINIAARSFQRQYRLGETSCPHPFPGSTHVPR